MKNSEEIKNLREDVYERVASSFRDPSGFVYRTEGILCRQVNRVYQREYELLMESGLYERLVKSNWIVPHQEVDFAPMRPDLAYKILRPEYLDFVSYPYEWCFSQLKDAALLTLNIQQAALEHGMSLKDASAYNIQFADGRPVFIDTLSFEKYQEGRPWVAYRQFCQHFLAPLALMAKTDIGLNKLLIAYIDGISLDLASKLLPRRSWLNFGLLMHLHLHAKTQKKYSDSGEAAKKAERPKGRAVKKMELIGIVKSLKNAVDKMSWQPGDTEWGDYYNITNYSDAAFDEKQRLVHRLLLKSKPKMVWDIGANTGVFSRLATALNIRTISFDIDPSAVEMNYRMAREKKEKMILPLLLDLTNPSPGIGWNCSEREAIVRRGPVDCIMALALIHHLAISNNLPFQQIAQFFQGLCGELIIEFVPKEDSQVKKMLSTRVDIFPDYNQSSFEEAFSSFFEIEDRIQIQETERTLYFMKNLERIPT
jgi:ribosomal protein L11 methylase PrmA